MNHANAIKLRAPYPAILWRVPGSEEVRDMLGTLDYGDLLMPAGLVEEIDGEEYVGVVCWVKRSEVMRCGE